MDSSATRVRTQRRRRPARDRLLAAADTLFYREGVATGVESLLAVADVSRGSLYNNFAGKAELVEAYLNARHDVMIDSLRHAAEHADGATSRVVAMFEVGRARSKEPGFRGCAFVIAVAETSGANDTILELARRHKVAVRHEFLRALGPGIPVADELAAELAIIFEGSLALASLAGEDDVFDRAQGLVQRLLQ